MRRATTKPPKASGETTATERAYETLLRWIRDRELAAGSVLDERRLAEAIDVSRTPLRSALSRLHGEGYIVRLTNGAMVVREIGSGEVLELLVVRRLLDPEAAALAAGKIPPSTLDRLKARIADTGKGGDSASVWLAGDQVHDLIAEHCGNRSLSGFIQEARHRIRMSNIERVPGRDAQAILEHMAIVDALIAGDREGARKAMTEHLDNIRDSYLVAFGFGARHAG